MFWKRRVYADAAAATPLSRRVRTELARLLPLYGNPGGLHKEAIAAKKELERARASVAASIGAHPDEIIFTSGGTEANNLAVSIAQGHAITLAIEHQSVLEPLRALKKGGLELTELSVQPEGTSIPTAVPDAVRPTTTFVSMQLVNSEIGSILPVREVAKELRRVKDRRIYLHTDASQAPLWMDIQVEKLGVDLLTLDGQKILGPKGVGILYIKRGVTIEPQLLGGGQERGLRGGTENVALAGAFAVALADAQYKPEKRAVKVAVVRDFLLAEIKKLLPEVQLHGPVGEKRVANNINISVPGLDGEMAVIAMDALGVAASTRSACGVGEEEPSYVIQALGVGRALAKSAVRITLLPDASMGDAKRIAAALAEAASRYRQR